MDDTRLYLVRVWQQASQFRASVRAADDDEAQLFTAPDALGAFFAEHAATAAAPAAPAPRATGRRP